MSSCRLLLFLTVVLGVFLCVQNVSGSSNCDRLKKFTNYEAVSDYINCLKSQTSSMRYGKRALPALLGKLRPDLYNDYENNFQQISDMYGEN